MNKLIYILHLVLLFCFSINFYGQNKYQLSGFVRDFQTKEVLIGANVYEIGKNNGIATDNNGYFSLKIEQGSKIKFSFIGYTDSTITISSRSDTLLNIFLLPGTQLNEVIVEAEGFKKFNVDRLSISEINNIPTLGGKTDVSKALQLLPGIISQGEGSSILLVRGGDPGQNLYLFDNVPVIYVNHLGGFFSVFNPDIINGIEVYKGAFPAKYGGRLSSIINITQKEGNITEHQGSFSIGLTDASILFEGPVKQNKASYILTARKTMVEPLMALASGLIDGNNSVLIYGFHDINGKIVWKPNTQNTLSLNLYYGDDYLYSWLKKKEEKMNTGVIWGNWLVSLNWKTAINPKLFTITTLSYTRYRLKDRQKYKQMELPFNVDGELQQYNSVLKSYVNDFSLKSDWKYHFNNYWALNFGFQTSYIIYNPNDIYRSNSVNQPETEIINVSESSVYLDNKISIVSQIYLDLGARLNNYFTSESNKITVEPRLSLSWNFLPSQRINVSYMKADQFSHLIFTTGEIMSNEMWLPSNKDIPNSSTNQYTFGWSGDFFRNKYSAEIILYYKELTDLATIKDHYTNILGDVNWKSKIISGGTGKSKGIEFFLKKNVGSWKGFISYTLSRSVRKFTEINNGNEFVFDFNRTHNFTINVNKELNEKLSLHFTWVYMSGLPYTPIKEKYLVPVITESGEFMDFTEVFVYGERNSEKMKDHHRLDIGLKYSKLTKRNRKCEWYFSIYNVYCRRNAFAYIYANYTEGGGDFLPFYDKEKMKLYQKTFLPLIPTFSYKVYF